MSAGGARRRRKVVVVVVVVVVVAVLLLLQAGGSSRPPRLRAPASGRGPAPRAPVLAPPAGTLTSPLASPGMPALPAPPRPMLGINVNRLFNDRAFTVPQIQSQLRDLAAAGATDARSDALWEAAEPQPPINGAHRYSWSFDDQIALSLAAHGLRWLPIVDYSPSWAQSIPGQDHSAPASARYYAAFARALAARYGHGGELWHQHPSLPARPVQALEIWNEPDGGQFWLPGPDPAGYANLYAAARAAAQAADPGLSVIVGGLTAPGRFLPELLAARPDLRGHLDGIGIHPYASRPQDILRRVSEARAVLRRLDLPGVPLYVTEFGWTTQPPGPHWLPARLRPGYLATTIGELAHTDCSVSGIFPYTWVTPEHNPANPDDWFGIHPPGGGTSADQTAFAAGMRAAVSPRAATPLCAP